MYINTFYKIKNNNIIKIKKKKKKKNNKKNKKKKKKKKKKIGQKYIVDATAMEELCTDTKIIIAVNKGGEICAMQKSLHGSLNPSLLTEMIRVSFILLNVINFKLYIYNNIKILLIYINIYLYHIISI